ncbi:MAG: hypothetical protein HZB50_12025 [Chloroflexi bacterium]|nr:hypothetical protein [Chloroflexota bacterium]
MKSNKSTILVVVLLFSMVFYSCSLFTSAEEIPTPNYIFTPSTTLLKIEPDSLPNAQTGVEYEVEIRVSDNVTPVSDAVISSGTLPAGLELVFVDHVDGAKISGVPEETGTFTFTVSVSCFSTMVIGQSAEKEYTIVVEDASSNMPTPLTFSGLPVSYNNISFNIPLELNASAIASASTEVEFPYINPSGGPMAEHVVFQFTNFPVSGDARIMVFKASEYAAYGESLQGVVTALLAGQDAAQPLPKALTQDFHAQAELVPFQNGHGVRYLTQGLTNFAPITNKEIFYYYQGITNDGAYFVAAIFPVNGSFLAADGNSPTPPDGIPFTNPTGSDFENYLNQISQKLNDTAAENYSPSLLLLDKLIASMQVTSP